VHVDRVQITQVIANLLTNAFQAAERGSVSVSLKQEAATVRISVADTGGGDDYRVYKASHDHILWRLPLQPAGSLARGTYRFPFRFQIPFEALPSYRSTHASVTYALTARLDVPWWPGAVGKSEVFVFYDRRSVRQYAHPVWFRSGSEGPEVFVELDGDRFFARELIGCRITLARLGTASVRRVYLRLFGGEWARANSDQEVTRNFEQEWSISMDRIRVDAPFEFMIPIPAEVASSYRGVHSYYSYALQVGLDVAWAQDIVALTPIILVR